MAHVLIMPRQGNTVESCIIIEWKKKEGDTVEADTPVCEVETDKATFEVPAGAAGTILKILHEAGDDVPVLQPILVVGNPGEDWQAAAAAAAPASADKPAAKAAESSVPVPPAADSTAAPVQPAAAPAARPENSPIAVSPRARTLALEEAVNIASVAGTGPGGRIIEADIQAAIAARPPLTAAAKEALRQGGAVPATGSGIGGRVTLADIETLAASGASAVPQSAAASGADFPGEYTDTPVKGIRKVIADRMMASLSSMAQFTLNSSACAVNLQALRSRFKASKPELGFGKITVNDLVLFAASRVLPLFPYMNAHKLDSTLRTFKSIHLGMAVDTPRGLMVPVIRNADSLSLTQISARAKELAEACQNGSIKPDDLTGSTLTVTNLGNTGIESFTPVVNAPEVAILGVCGIQPKPKETAPGQYEILPHLSFSLTIDHAVVDGAPAAKFLKAFCEAVADIDIWIAK